jgi:hypothetical protein
MIMSIDQKPSSENIQELSERTRTSINQLRSIQVLPLPRKRQLLVVDLIVNAQTYLVFLEECAKLIKDGGVVNNALLNPVKNHCVAVEKAWLEVKAEFDQQGRKT